MSTKLKHTPKSNFRIAPRLLAGDTNRTAEQFIFTIDRLIGDDSPSDTLWNYCAQFRKSALKDAGQNLKLKQERDELLAALIRLLAYSDGFTQHSADKPDAKRQARQAIANATT